MDEDRVQLITSLEDLLMYGASIHAPAGVLKAMVQLINDAQSYDPSNRSLDWQPINNRHPESLLGERNMFVYIMHVWTVSPPWVGIELLDSMQDQYTKALDIRIVDRKDHPETEQCKTGHLGKSKDLYVHKGWLEGSPDNVVATCIEHGIIYGGPMTAWKQTYKEGSSAIRDEEKWMNTPYFKECGGWIVDIHEDVKKLIPVEETTE